MAKLCVICGKCKTSGMKVSHSNIKTKRRWRPNIHKIRVLVDGSPQRLNVCTRCMKAGRIKRAL
ncbi:MAG: 50S ribosomal protein L28 [Bacillota bacterium]